MLCTKCGANCAEGTTYCIHCGNRVSAPEAPQPPPQGYSYYNPGGGDPNANQYANTTVQNNEPVSVGDWVLTILVQAIPVVGIIMMFIWGFGGDAKKSKSNYCKAALIWMAIGVVLWIFMVVVFASVFFEIAKNISYYS